ncbi:MAG: hypothetical protein ACTHK7_01890 [Aureliella sp.]
MSKGRFGSPAGKTFSVQLYDPTTLATVGAAIAGVTDSTVPTLYEFNTAATGIALMVATATNLRVAGYVDLDNPDATGASPVVDTYEEAAGTGVDLTSITDQLDLIQAKTDRIGTGTATISAPVTATGKLNELTIGDDYLATYGRSFSWTIAKPSNFPVDGAVAWFGGSRDSCQKWLVSGSITDNGDGTLTLEFELPKEKTSGLEEGNYDWSVAIHDANDVQITTVKNGSTGVTLSKKFTNQ